MAEPDRNRIEEWFQQQFGRYEERLQPEQKQTVIDSITKDMTRETDQSKAASEPSKHQEYRDSRLKAAAEIEEGMWEGNETERTAYRFWKPERTVEAGDHPLEFPTDYRLDALVPWERGTSTLDEGAQVYEMTGHEWLKEGDIVTTPEGLGYVVTPDFKAHERAQNAPDFAWSGSYSETVNVSNLALDQSKESPDPAQTIEESEKQEAVKDFGHAIDAQEHREASWLQRVEDRTQTSLWEGKGQADELMIKSAGQYSNSWSEAVRPDKGPKDMQAAMESMGITKAAERQAAQEKGAEKTQERGGEGMER